MNLLDSIGNKAGGLAAMFAVSIWDFASPANRRCSANGCALPAKQAATDRIS